MASRERPVYGSVSSDTGTRRNFRIEQDDQWAFDLAITVVGSASAPQLIVGSALQEQAP
jgi:hypothetical protein